MNSDIKTANQKVKEEIYTYFKPNRVFRELLDNFTDRGGNSEILAIQMGKKDIYTLTKNAQFPRADGYPGRAMLTLGDIITSYLATCDPILIDKTLNSIGLRSSIPKSPAGQTNGSINDEIGELNINLGEMIQAAQNLSNRKAIKETRNHIEKIYRALATLEAEVNESEVRINREEL